MELLAKNLSLYRLGYSNFEIKSEMMNKNYNNIYGNFHHAAYIFEQKGNSINILSKGINYFGFNKSTHAECDAIIKLKPRRNKNLKKINILVIRTSKSGKLGSSQPCYHCAKQMNDIGNLGYKINNIYYSNNDESMTKIKFNKFIQSDEFHISGFYKKKYYQTCQVS
jgi:cytidine deaminase